jgi:hypothetical protein
MKSSIFVFMFAMLMVQNSHAICFLFCPDENETKINELLNNADRDPRTLRGVLKSGGACQIDFYPGEVSGVYSLSINDPNRITSHGFPQFIVGFQSNTTQNQQVTVNNRTQFKIVGSSSGTPAELAIQRRDNRIAVAITGSGADGQLINRICIANLR